MSVPETSEGFVSEPLRQGYKELSVHTLTECGSGLQIDRKLNIRRVYCLQTSSNIFPYSFKPCCPDFFKPV